MSVDGNGRSFMPKWALHLLDCKFSATLRASVTILRQSRRLYGCWPLKGAFSQPLKAKARTTEKALKAKPGHTPGNVKLLLPPRQSRGNSRDIRIDGVASGKLIVDYLCCMSLLRSLRKS